MHKPSALQPARLRLVRLDPPLQAVSRASQQPQAAASPCRWVPIGSATRALPPAPPPPPLLHPPTARFGRHL